MKRGNIKISPITPDPAVISYILSDQVRAHCAGVYRMLPKAKVRCYLIEGLTSYEANILKQECLSVGADLAISREAILKNRKNEKTLLLATEKQLLRILNKIRDQRFSGFEELVGIFDAKINTPVWQVRSRRIELNRPILMGIINITPDSFSGDGILSLDDALRQAEDFLAAGAEILDIGAESSRPGAKRVSEEEEIQRLIPALKAIRKKFPKAILSVDTYKPTVAEIACKEGVDIINDITGLRSPKMRRVVQKYGVGAVIMHMKGSPQTMQKRPLKGDVVGLVYEFLKRRVKNAVSDGIEENRLVIDPGIGFGKKWQDNYRLLAFTSLFASVRPVLVGASRKSLIGFLTGAEIGGRLPGTIAVNLYAWSRGASIFRVHDVAEHQQAFRVWEELRRYSS